MVIGKLPSMLNYSKYFYRRFDKRGAKESLIGSLILSLIGNLLYSFSGISNKWMILASRTIVGFGTGVLSVIRAYVGTVTTKEERTRFMAYTSVTQFLGFALMPSKYYSFIIIIHLSFSF
jgi:MFS family permease